MAGSGSRQYLLETVSFAVRTITGEYLGEVVAVATDREGVVEGVVIARSGAFAGRTVVPAALVLGANAAERAVILNVGTAATLKQLRQNTIAPVEAPVETPTGEAYLLFLPAAGGYRLIARDGPAPAEAIIDFEDRPYRIVKVAHSPLPGDARRCVYLLAEL
jgi:PRC-barrel domain